MTILRHKIFLVCLFVSIASGASSAQTDRPTVSPTPDDRYRPSTGVCIIRDTDISQGA
jgi:hypothetical protein